MVYDLPAKDIGSSINDIRVAFLAAKPGRWYLHNGNGFLAQPISELSVDTAATSGIETMPDIRFPDRI
jgi:hypothetical protein